MATQNTDPVGPDFAAGVPLRDVPEEGLLAGHVGGDPLLLVRFEGRLQAFDGVCTHYGARLAGGLVVGQTVRCPLHHACFSLRTGEALSAPAFDPLGAWRVEVEGEIVFVRERDTIPVEPPARRTVPPAVQRLVIIGGGAAGFAAAEMLRRSGFDGSLTMLSADTAPPCDRPNLSKDYLAGSAPEAWIPLKDEGFYRSNDIDLRLGATAAAVSPDAKQVLLEDGEAIAYDACLLATGSQPIRLQLPGFDQPNVYTLRSLDDARAIIKASQTARTAAIIGASFIGLEVAAALRTRGLEVHVVAPESIPMERVLGAELGEFILALHREKGVRFHLGRAAESFHAGELRVAGGAAIHADLVVLGVGVTPRLELARTAGLTLDRGVLVDPFFRTGAPGLFAAGDIANYRDPLSGDRIRVEHWAAALRQGQCAAINMLGERRPFDSVPFFWSNHYEAAIRYVGHGSGADRTEIAGSVSSGEATIRFFRAGRLVAAASLGRDVENLEIEAELETLARADAPTVELA